MQAIWQTTLIAGDKVGARHPARADEQGIGIHDSGNLIALILKGVE